MLKIFRRIRQKMLTQNKVSNYLLYSIKEIVLVVIGILIALQINNWNKNSKQRKIEYEYLVSLIEEFGHNLLELDSEMKKNNIMQITH